MSEAFLFVASGIALLALVAVLVWPRRLGRHGGATRAELPNLSQEDLTPRHAKYFPLVRQALSGSDLAELGRRIPHRMRAALRTERRKVARRYLQGLREDYLRLEKFGRMVAALSPKVDARQEAERLRLGIRFRMVYAAVSMRLALGEVPVPAFERLTRLVGSLATRLEASMTSLVEPGPTQAGAN
ncbi:MAG: hypothetical protein WBF06_08760 [Candidatus Acidiferrales bacterium]